MILLWRICREGPVSWPASLSCAAFSRLARTNGRMCNRRHSCRLMDHPGNGMRMVCTSRGCAMLNPCMVVVESPELARRCPLARLPKASPPTHRMSRMAVEEPLVHHPCRTPPSLNLHSSAHAYCSMSLNHYYCLCMGPALQRNQDPLPSC